VNDWVRVGTSVTVGAVLAALVAGAPRSRSQAVFIYYINSEERDQESPIVKAQSLCICGALCSPPLALTAKSERAVESLLLS
jgi:hypothetical protein